MVQLIPVLIGAAAATAVLAVTIFVVVVCCKIKTRKREHVDVENTKSSISKPLAGKHTML